MLIHLKGGKKKALTLNTSHFYVCRSVLTLQLHIITCGMFFFVFFCQLLLTNPQFFLIFIKRKYSALTPQNGNINRYSNKNTDIISRVHPLLTLKNTYNCSFNNNIGIVIKSVCKRASPELREPWTRAVMWSSKRFKLVKPVHQLRRSNYLLKKKKDNLFEAEATISTAGSRCTCACTHPICHAPVCG